MQEVPRLTRLLALWSLSTSGMVKPQAVEPLFYSIFANPAEATEMRIAAFNILVKLNPPMAIFQKIAARTWVERDMEVLKVVNSGKYTVQFWSISQFHELFFDQIPFFAISKMDKNQFLNWEKV